MRLDGHGGHAIFQSAERDGFLIAVVLPYHATQPFVNAAVEVSTEGGRGPCQPRQMRAALLRLGGPQHQGCTCPSGSSPSIIELSVGAQSNVVNRASADDVCAVVSGEVAVCAGMGHIASLLGLAKCQNRQFSGFDLVVGIDASDGTLVVGRVERPVLDSGSSCKQGNTGQCVCMWAIMDRIPHDVQHGSAYTTA